MEHIARAVGRDPVDVKIENLENESVFKTMMPEFITSVGKLCNLMAGTEF